MPDRDPATTQTTSPPSWPIPANDPVTGYCPGMSTPKQQRAMTSATAGMVIGLLLGVVIGLVTDVGVGLGIGIGIAVGAGLGAAGWLFADATDQQKRD